MSYDFFVSNIFESVLADIGDSFKIEYEDDENPVK